MILTLILIAVTLMSIANLALAAGNKEASEAAKAAIRRHGLGGVPVGCLVAISAFITVGLWTWYAFDQQDWRYAAIVWVPFICNMLSRSVTKERRFVER